MSAGQLAVVPQDQRLTAPGNAVDLQLGGLRLELPPQPCDQVAQPLAPRPRCVGRTGGRRRQFIPGLANGRQRADVRLGLGQGRPEQRQVLRTQASLGGESGQYRIGSAERRALPVLPGRKEIIRQIDVVPLVEIEDALHAVLVAVGFGHGRIGSEDEAFGLEDDMVRHPPRRLQVLLQEGRRHGQRFARVIEAGFIGGIDRKFAGRTDIAAGQVADGVVELGVAQAPGQDDARIAGVAIRLPRKQVANPGADRSPFVGGRLTGRVLRRHLSRVQALEHLFPAPRVPGDRRDGAIATQVEVRLRPSRSVTGVAIALEERLDLCGKTAFEGVAFRLLRTRGAFAAELEDITAAGDSKAEHQQAKEEAGAACPGHRTFTGWGSNAPSGCEESGCIITARGTFRKESLLRAIQLLPGPLSRAVKAASAFNAATLSLRPILAACTACRSRSRLASYSGRSTA